MNRRVLLKSLVTIALAPKLVAELDLPAPLQTIGEEETFFYDGKKYSIARQRSVTIHFTSNQQSDSYVFYLHKPPKWAKYFSRVTTRNMAKPKTT